MIADGGLDFLAGLGLVVDERALVGDAGVRGPAIRPFRSNPQRLVGLGELAVRGVVIGVDLYDAPARLCPDGLEAVTDGREIGGDLHFDLVHARGDGRRS